MSMWRRFLGLDADEVTGFSESEPKPVADVIFEMTYGNALLPKVGRSEALSVPGVMRARNMICGSIGALPLMTYARDNSTVDNRLFRQIDPAETNVYTITATLEDLFFDRISWWHVLERGSDRYPVSAEHVELARVSETEEKGGIVRRLDGVVVPTEDLILFRSPNPGLLAYAGRTIRRAVDLDRTASTYADNPRPLDYFSPTEGADPLDDDEVPGLLARWREARRKRATAYVPAALTYNTVDAPTPQALQLVEAQRQVSIDIANMTGLDPEDLGVSTTSRSYFNGDQRRRERINDVFKPYMRAVTDRLSMGDITKNGYRVEFDLDDYLKADPATRWASYKTAHELGAITTEEIRQEERMRPLTGSAQPQPPIEASAKRGQTFAGETAEHFDFADQDVTGFAVDRERRTITGLVVPYGQVARKNGRRFRFAPGSIKFAQDIGRVKLLRDHDRSQAIGKAVEFTETPEGLVGKFSVAPGPEGDRALALAEHGTLDGLSVGVEEMVFGPDPSNRGVLLVSAALGREVSLTAMPAFDSSRLTSVAASADEGEQVDPEEQTPAAQPGTEQKFTAADVALLLANMNRPQEPANGPAVIPPRRVVTTEVNEALPYSFSRDGSFQRGPNGYDFSSDVFAAAKGDREAKARAEEFISAAFDTDRADVAALNPNRQRPDMYVDQMDYVTPLWDMVSVGTLQDSTPFIVPKFNSSSNLVGPHTEGVEPTPGTFTATTQTITPSAVSGKVEITRETIDAGGNPQVSTLIWRQMLREYYEEREQSVATFLNTLTAATDIALTTAAADDALAGELEGALARLQFVRGGNRFRAFAVHVDLYTALADARDADGRPLYPVLAPQNANGTAASLFGTLNVAGTLAVPAWALGATGTASANSWLFDPAKVLGWASTPRQLNFEYQVKSVEMGIWGYTALANTDIAGVRQVTYDPAA